MSENHAAELITSLDCLTEEVRNMRAELLMLRKSMDNFQKGFTPRKSSSELNEEDYTPDASWTQGSELGTSTYESDKTNSDSSQNQKRRTESPSLLSKIKFSKGDKKDKKKKSPGREKRSNK